MFVKKLVLKNFKSFPSAKIVFEKGFNAFVGPNGSGKSNLIDSLLFAFGESSLKSMRVKKTGDLVYKKRPSAEVSVLLQEGEGERAEKHEVKRVVRKDGKAKYSLDGRRVKKYVIEDFLASHRISLNNMIKQGQVERIIEMNPRDRRTLIDFVANVSEYEEKKKEAFRELDKVEEKLREVRTLLAEREGYLKELEEDKKNAERFLEFESRVKALKATLLYLDLHELEKEFESLVNACLDANNKTESLQKAIAEIGDRIASKQGEVDEVNREITERGQGQELEIQKQIDSLNAEITLCQRLIEERKQSIAKNDSREREISLEKTKAGDEVKGVTRQLEEIGKELTAIKSLLEKEQDKIKGLYQESSDFSSGFQDARKTLDKANEEMLSCKEKLGALQAEISKQQELKRLKENELSRLKAGRGLEDYSEKKKALKQEIEFKEKELRESQSEIDDFVKKERKVDERITVLEDLILVAREKIAEKHALLRASGENKALQAVTQLQKEVRGVHGTLQQLCSYSSKHSLPISVALRNRFNYIAVDSVDVASNAIEFLKRKKVGRASFIPLDKIRVPSKPDKTLLKEKGAVGFVFDFLKFDKKFSKAFAYACSNTLLMKDLQSAKRLVGRTRLVTQEGELVEASGLVTGGHTIPKTNVFQEARELKEWQDKVEASAREKEELVENLSALHQQLSAARKNRASLELALKTVELELRSVEEQEDDALKKVQDIAGAVKSLEKEIGECENAIRAGDEERAGLVRRISELNVVALEAKQKIDVEKETRFGLEIKEVERKISEYRLAVSERENQVGSLEAQKKVFEGALESVLKQEQGLKQEFDKAKQDLREADERIKAAREQLKEKSVEQKRLSTAFKELVEKREAFSSEVMQLGNEKGKLQFELDKISTTKNESDVQKAVVETKLSDLKAQYAEFEDVKVIEGKALEDKPKLSVELKKVEEEMQRLGSINLRAIQAFEEKAKEIVKQKERAMQLENEKEAVISIITEIEGKKKATFMKTFDAINANFQKLFKQIFVGEGSLVLENPENPFEGGLTIQAQLGTHEIKYLELMSGGEKALVALLFLFSIQSINPGSIYVLDEADAALDQENSRKLAELLKKLCRSTQFLVVTHNETVIKNADCLIGVAKSRHGSKLVEVKLARPEDVAAKSG